ncbi:putative predicted SAM-dependent RNA methyltransferase [Lyophyllum shimeji]|uniref:Predicted SAM-dependent RNA methyltransferase n=1 Tax=Lyophyllum shimeji TaxID=47721 RepID=A0A9P3PQM3_LYOSH|nr:putative predicted SAM-dependent RNA methyltransferase [Lyophyllum shimeji]
MSFSYVIEHMEEDEDTARSIPPWVELEYAHMRTLAGPDARVHFTHLSKSSSGSLSTAFQSSQEGLAEALCYQMSVLDLMKSKGIGIDRVCLLDPKAREGLSPEDGDGRFDMFLFGGILGDDPPRDRTAELRVMGFPTRHLGPVQMTTDTALGVTKLVIKDKKPLSEIPYVDFPTIRFNSRESVEMPFRYIADKGGEPLLPPGMRKLLHEDLNKAFDDL